MTKEELANKLNGREYRKEMSEEEEYNANGYGLLVVFGASNDLLEFRGSFCDESSRTDGQGIDSRGFLEDCKNEDCPFRKWPEVAFRKKATVLAKWNSQGYSLFIDADVPYAPFDIMEDGEKYCRGIVISVKDLP